MAGFGHLNKLSTTVRDDALARLEALLPSGADDGEGREAEALQTSTRDRVASKDPTFQINALVGALTRNVESQQQEIDTLKRTKANAASVSKRSDK